MSAQTLHTERFHRFLAEFTQFMDSAPEEATILSQGRDILARLVAHDDWLSPEHAQPHPQYYQQYLLYLDPRERFSVVSFVWGPGQSTPVHDHTVWGLIGMLRGSEWAQPYSRMSDGRWAPAGLALDLHPGDVEVVSPRVGDVHQVRNAVPDQVSISIHVYGADIGRVKRHVYLPDGTRKDFVSGYSNRPAAVVPTEVPSSSTVAPSAAVSSPTSTPPLTQTAALAQATASKAENLSSAAPTAIKPEGQTATAALATSSTSSLPSAPARSTDATSVNVSDFAWVEPHEVHQAWKNRDEIALLDVREEDPYAQSHPLFAANLPLSRIEVDALRRLPRKTVRVVVFDAGEGLAEKAAHRLKALGYSHVELLRGGLTGWAAAGLELFRDVNVPSKAFGEWVEDQRHTPSLSAQEVKALLDNKADVVVMDVRRFDEYQTMNIPGSISVPGGELVLRARALAPNPSTRIVVNCAGRTRSIIGTQSLVNAGIPNPVSALRNGTIGWTLAQQSLEQGASRRFSDDIPAETLQKTRQSAFAVTVRAGVGRIQREDLAVMLAQADRTTYVLDVRTPEEYALGHWPGALSTPGGQLVQETDHTVPIRGARIVLCDTDQVRAPMTASWLAQMGWEVHLLQGLSEQDLSDTSPSPNPQPEWPTGVTAIEPAQLKTWLSDRSNLTQVIDFGPSMAYVKRHIPGAWWLLRSQLQQDFARVHKANRYVLTCTDGLLSPHVVPELRALVRTGVEVFALKGGNAAWWAQGFSGQQGESYVASPRTDRYRRPYEGTQVSPQAMQAYLDWEFGLVAQLRRDGSHHFKVI